MTRPLPAYKRIAQDAGLLCAEGLSIREIARRLKVDFDTAKKALAIAGVTSTPAAPSVEEGWKEDGDTATWAAVLPKPIRTLAEATKAAEVDTAVWFVDRWECTAWTTVTKDADDKPVQTQQHRVKVYLRRIAKRSIQEAFTEVFAELRKRPTKWPKLATPCPKGRQYLAVPTLFDVHFGKYAWHEETGENYDLKIAEQLYFNAVEDLVAECRHRPIARIVMPFGNDWMHVDGRNYSTSKGTPQDHDGRLSKVFATALMAAIKGVEAFAAVAPVEVVLVPGNHDRTLSECLCHALDARFHMTNRVTVDVSPKTRKYFRWGTTLLGLTHGDLVKPDKLPGLMPVEMKKDWAETTCHEWLTGHGHRSQKWTTLDTDTQQGTVVRQLRALTRTDLWHFDHGYVGTSPAAECYFYEKSRGYSGHSLIPERTGIASTRRCG